MQKFKNKKKQKTFLYSYTQYCSPRLNIFFVVFAPQRQYVQTNTVLSGCLLFYLFNKVAVINVSAFRFMNETAKNQPGKNEIKN